MDYGMNYDKFVQNSHFSKAKYLWFSSPEQQVIILCSIVQPTFFLAIIVADKFQ